ncbi:hypothetical protein QTG56_25745 (plasmid) [Rossellomorea sp. AcN35-11]|nr:hypothetical protein [Rossellomorea aquimaris]WJV32020.1 hypothetical protein QTG56_25745 [Rossellomorea sp. AcN35-11]
MTYSKKTVIFNFEGPVSVTVAGQENDVDTIEKAKEQLFRNVDKYIKHGVLEGEKLGEEGLFPGLPIRTSGGKNGIILSTRRVNNELILKVVNLENTVVYNPDIAYLLKVSEKEPIEEFLSRRNKIRKYPEPMNTFEGRLETGEWMEGEVGYYVHGYDIYPVVMVSRKKLAVISHQKTKGFRVEGMQFNNIFDTKKEAEKNIKEKKNKDMPHLRF